MRWLNSITKSMDMNLSKLWEIDNEGQRSLVCYSPWGPKEWDTTYPLNNNILIPLTCPEPTENISKRNKQAKHPNKNPYSHKCL